MEERKGSLSYFGGIVRIVIFLVILVLLAFFLVRWAQNRQANEDNTANNSDTTSQVSDSSNPSSSSDDSKKSDDTKATDTNKQTDSNSSNSQDSGKGSTNSNGDSSNKQSTLSDSKGKTSVDKTDNLPSTGLGTNIALTASVITAVIYLISKNFGYKKEIKANL